MSKPAKILTTFREEDTVRPKSCRQFCQPVGDAPTLQIVSLATIQLKKRRIACHTRSKLP